MLMEIFSYPFMQRAAIAGIFLGLMLASLGVVASLRKMSFFSEGVAHASLAGIAIALLINVSPLPVAIIWAMIIALAIFKIERSTNLNSDTAIGILFTASMALGILIISLLPGYQPELMSFLFGSILTVKSIDLWIIIALSLLILIWFFPTLKKLTFLSLNEETAIVNGINTKIITLIFYLSLAIATVLGVKILGIVLVSALLIIPPATGRLLANSFKSYFVFSILAAEFSIFAGLLLSVQYNLPSGAAIVLASALLFTFAMFKKIKF
ncbi:metal ABC transporter permease [Candidatus Parcubacteria bacterium]|nr:MAG: metal ABC transporter permease [Candidatus Parcubacteria bacterium]